MGFVVLDAHHNPWDILLTARHFHAKKYRILMPIAGYVFYVPLLKSVVMLFQKRYDILLYPVYRKEEASPVNWVMRILVKFYPEKISDAQRQVFNNKFIDNAIEFVKSPNHVIVVAPYGSPIWFGGKVKYGVRRLLESGAKYCVSETRWNTKLGKLRTYTTETDLMKEFHNLTQIA